MERQCLDLGHGEAGDVGDAVALHFNPDCIEKHDTPDTGCTKESQLGSDPTTD